MRLLTFAFLLTATSGMAQSPNQVTLKYDDGTGVSGELVKFSDEIFRIQASVGLIAIPAREVSCIGAACPEGTALDLPPAPVKLTGNDGTVISGNLIEFVQNQYVLATEFGEVVIDADLVTCGGAACPANKQSVNREVTLTSGATVISGELFDFKGGQYIVDVSDLGRLKLDATVFSCQGSACQ